MTEFDFDELDKAVSNLMGKAEGGNVQSSASAPSGVQNSPAPISQQPANNGGSNPVDRAPSIAKRRRGQFMDVKPPASFTRQPMASRPRAQADSQSVSDPVVSNNQSTALSQDHIEEEQKISPFLSDAKVEKRPLGMANIEPISSGQIEAEQPIVENIDRIPANEVVSEELTVAKPGEDDIINAALPAELRSDVLDVESNTPSHDDQSAHEVDALASPQLPSEGQSDNEETPVATLQTDDSVASAVEQAYEEPKEPAADSSPVSEPPSSRAPVAAANLEVTPQPVTSIQPQYTTKAPASNADAEHSSVFDVDPPILTKPKKKNGWLTVLAIIGIIIISIGGGVAAFYLTNGVKWPL